MDMVVEDDYSNHHPQAEHLGFFILKSGTMLPGIRNVICTLGHTYKTGGNTF